MGKGWHEHQVCNGELAQASTQLIPMTLLRLWARVGEGVPSMEGALHRRASKGIGALQTLRHTPPITSLIARLPATGEARDAPPPRCPPATAPPGTAAERAAPTEAVWISTTGSGAGLAEPPLPPASGSAARHGLPASPALATPQPTPRRPLVSDAALRRGA